MPVWLLLSVCIIAIYFGTLLRKKRGTKQNSEISVEIPSGTDLWDTGRAGERYTREVLEQLEGYKQIISNAYLPKADGTFTEVDLILLHESGIYVIESKNYSGWIFGNEEQKQWTQSLPSGNRHTKKVRFFNPILQNKGHLKWLRKYADIGKDIPFYSFIVFSDRCELKKITLTSGNHFVINRRDLLQRVRENAESAGFRFSQVEIDILYKRLYPLTQVSEEQKTLHIKDVQMKKTPSPPAPSIEPSKPERRSCPRCGGELVIRTAKKGERTGTQFLGCSNFPKCRFTQELDESICNHT